MSQPRRRYHDENEGCSFMDGVDACSRLATADRESLCARLWGGPDSVRFLGAEARIDRARAACEKQVSRSAKEQNLPAAKRVRPQYRINIEESTKRFPRSFVDGTGELRAVHSSPTAERICANAFRDAYLRGLEAGRAFAGEY